VPKEKDRFVGFNLRGTKYIPFKQSEEFAKILRVCGLLIPLLLAGQMIHKSVETEEHYKSTLHLSQAKHEVRNPG
jgi:hypothetical protein